MKKKLKQVYTKMANSKFWQKEGFWHYSIIFLVALIFCGLYLYLGTGGYFVGGDDALFHISRYFSTIRGWLDGQIVPQTDPTFLSGIGHSWNIFYGPLPAYAVNILFLWIRNWQFSIAIMMFGAVFLAGVFSYRFMKEIFKDEKWGNVIALIGSIIYIWSPYLIINFYGRAAVGEVFAFLFIPLVFHGIWRLVNNKKGCVALLVAGMAGLVLSHLLSVVIAIIFGGLFILLNIKKIIPHWKKVVKNLLLAVVITLGVTAFFVLPFMKNMSLGIYAINNDWFAENIMYFNPESINNNRLAITNSWLGTRNFGFYSVVIFAIICAIFAIFKKPKKSIKKDIKIFFILLALALVLTTTLIDWRFVPEMFYTIQFPTRFMGIASLFGAIIASYGIVWLIRKMKSKKFKVFFAIIFSVAVIIFGLFRIPWNVDKNTDADNLSTTTNTGLNEYYTMGFLKDGFSTELADSGKKYEVYGDAEVASFEFNADSSLRKFYVESESESTVELSQVYYSGFQAVDNDGNKLDTTYSENGLVQITIPAGFSGQVTSKFSNDTVTKVGLAITICTTICLILFYYISKKHPELSGYRKS